MLFALEATGLLVEPSLVLGPEYMLHTHFTELICAELNLRVHPFMNPSKSLELVRDEDVNLRTEDKYLLQD